MGAYRGASREHEISAARRRHDTRSWLRRVDAWWLTGHGAMLGLCLWPVLGLLLWPLPLSGECGLLLLACYARRYVCLRWRRVDFPYRVPQVAQCLDGSLGTPQLGQGITYLGMDLEAGQPVYASNLDMRTHMLVLGTTGSGKTEFLLGLVANALMQNSGCIYVDGKGDPKLHADMFRLCRHFGREDDLLVLNFISNGQDRYGTGSGGQTHTLNLMAHVPSGMLIELLVSLLDDSGGQGGDVWKGRAMSFVAALTRPLVYRRDRQGLPLSPDSFLRHLELNVLEQLAWQGGDEPAWTRVVAPLQSYLLTLPGYRRDKLGQQDARALEQHGFISMQLTRMLNDLAYHYGHIFNDSQGDVDFADVVLNRRVLLVLLPALERAPDSLRMLGKLIVGSIKQMMAGALGSRLEGPLRTLLDSRPTQAPVPFYMILDEYGYYAVNGFAVAPAQARSLGFSVVFAAQDFASLKKGSPEEADATWENTNIRVVGRITSGEQSETWERIAGVAGSVDEVVTAGYEQCGEGLSGSYRAQTELRIEARPRLAYDDLAMQENGEFTLLVGKKEQGGARGGVRVMRTRGFYTAGPAPREVVLNRLLASGVCARSGGDARACVPPGGRDDAIAWAHLLHHQGQPPAGGVAVPG